MAAGCIFDLKKKFGRVLICWVWSVFLCNFLSYRMSRTYLRGSGDDNNGFRQSLWIIEYVLLTLFFYSIDQIHHRLNVRFQFNKSISNKFLYSCSEKTKCFTQNDGISTVICIFSPFILKCRI